MILQPLDRKINDLRKGRKIIMLRKPVVVSIFIIVILSLIGVTACSSRSAATGIGNSNTTVKQTRIQAQITGDTVTIPVSTLDKYSNVKFLVKTATSNMAFMAYKYGDKTFVRADLCVPCGSESFTIKGSTLVCDACGTVFDIQTGKGLRGVSACQGYPKQPVIFQVIDGNIVMNGADLAAAFQSTLNPKKS
jgi:nitrite reductase/ring-hydroxylating ferredoxin subunit